MFLQDKIKDINTQLKVLGKVSNIIIWGAGVHTGKLFEKTDLFSYTIKNVVDIDEKKWGEKFFGFIIRSPEEISWDDVDAVVISVFNRDQQIMAALLDDFKFKGKIVQLYRDNECTPFYRLMDKRRLGIQFVGDYDSWEMAYQKCGKGYGDAEIMSTVINATQKVLDGEAEWERDGCTFHEQKFVYCICAAILRCAVQNKNEGVRVLDIGGSLGSTYLQNRKYLTDVRNLEYVIAEQENFADFGHKNREDDVLKFIKSTDDFKNYGRFDIILLSGSLQYIGNYKEILSKIIEARPHYIILDRIMISDRMRICREIVPAKLCESSYPIRIFSENDIDTFFKPDYVMVEKDEASTPGEVYLIDGKADFRYYVFQCINEKI